jgi:hypothetical protein
MSRLENLLVVVCIVLIVVIIGGRKDEPDGGMETTRESEQHQYVESFDTPTLAIESWRSYSLAILSIAGKEMDVTMKLKDILFDISMQWRNMSDEDFEKSGGMINVNNFAPTELFVPPTECKYIQTRVEASNCLEVYGNSIVDHVMQYAIDMLKCFDIIVDISNQLVTMSIEDYYTYYKDSMVELFKTYKHMTYDLWDEPFEWTNGDVLISLLKQYRLSMSKRTS